MNYIQYLLLFCLLWNVKLILHFSNYNEFLLKVIYVFCCFCFKFTFSFYRVTNNNHMLRKKKQKLYTSLAEQQELLEEFYNDLDDETFLAMNLVVKEKMKKMFLVFLQTLMLMYLIKIMIVLHNQLMRKTWYQGNKSLKILMMSWN